MDPLFETALALVGDAILLGRGGVVEDVNPAFARLSGRSREWCVGRAFDELRIGGTHPAILCADGTHLPVELEARVVNGRTLEVLRQVRAADDLYRLLTENASDLITTVDARGVLTYVSPSVRRLLGYAPCELIGTSSLDLNHPEDREVRRARIAQLASSAADDAAPLLITRARHKDGHYVHLEASSRVLRDDKGAFVALQSICRDVTARVGAEQALRRAEESFREVILALPEPAIVHRDGRILVANARFASLLGCARADELLDVDPTSLIHPEDRELVAREVARLPGQSRTGEHRLVAQDGTSVDVNIGSIPVLFEGKVSRVVIVRDLREQKRIEAELAVAERLASLGRLASAVGHEINNPLTYVLGTLEDLDSELARSADAAGLRARLAVVREGAERVRDIVRDMRALSPAADPSLGAHAGSELGRVLDLAAATAGHEIRHRARLVVGGAESMLVRGAEGRLVQVFVNLLVNAAQSIPDGNVEGNEIRVVRRRAGANAIVEVHDTGCGIPVRDATRIFDPFFTTKPGVGTGLGLAIVQRIVADVGGSIHAEARGTRGTTFRVTLPIVAVGDAEVRDRHSAPPSVSGRILVVDDAPLIGRAIANLLDTHDVVLASSGREAIEVLGRDERFDAILCDLQMKELSGVDVYDWLLANRPPLASRIGFMTGGVFTDRASAFLSGAKRPYLAKPFEMRALDAFVARLVDEGRTR